MDTVHQGMMMAYEYDLLIRRFGDIGPIAKPYIDVNVTIQLMLSVFVAVPIQIFFLYRIYRLSGNKTILPIFLITCVTLETITGLLFTGRTLATQSVTVALSPAMKSIATTYIVVTAFVDLAIAISMVFMLRSARIEGMSQTGRLMRNLIIYSVNTGLWTALVAISFAIVMVFYPATTVYVALSLPISCLYANTLLANLNVRQYIRGMGMHPDIVIDLGPGTAPDTSGVVGDSLNFIRSDGLTSGNTTTFEMINSNVVKLGASIETGSGHGRVLVY